MGLSEVLGQEVKKFLASKKSTILILGGSPEERHEVAGGLREQTLGQYFIYESGKPSDFERADPYIINISSLLQVSS